ncbi:Dbp6 protein [Candida orthopsilosis Co 90-125]|uniref:ATP-dependent RNA helicase n=1 Tax=Candida orthopsilosis (strain 90-125) TaxID=1136231 RepID=H8XAP6_CANO9|nr:Dbp6 protein [Candida orthopsilosis Co 90-125]CCG24896.1 Dbp6 protein [Candida orthopsilosis Co 90-125]
MFGTRYDPDEPTSISVSNAKRKREEASESSESENEQDDAKELSKSDDESSDDDREGSKISDDIIEKTEARFEVSEESDVEMEGPEPNGDPSYESKHEAVFNKFKQSTTTIGQRESVSEDEKEEVVDTQDLAPLPQPQLPRDKKLTSTSQYSKNLDWLTTPQYVTPNEKLSFQGLGVDETVLNNLKSHGFNEAFAVQVSVLKTIIPEIIANKRRPDAFGDILVNASTGSGKTLAYSIPIVQALHDRVVPRVRAIVLVPTRPLINQVKTTMLQLSQGTNLSVVGLKNDISIKEESEKLKKMVPDIVVSTPGRLVEHLNINSISLSGLRFLVIDEADRLLNQSFQNWSSVLTNKIDEQQKRDISERWSLKVQKLVFSATLTTDAGKLSNLNFYKPRLIIVNDTEQLVNEMFSVPSLLSEFIIHYGVAKNSLKPLILAKFLASQKKLSNVLIFTKSNESCIRLSKLLQLIMDAFSMSINVAFINSTNNRTSVRARVLRDFSTQKINILIATDLIARGIDLTTITDVINYDLPNSSREYVHRVGRTARAKNAGNAYNFVFGKGERKWFNTFSRDIGRGDKEVEPLELKLSEVITKHDEEVYQKALLDLQQQAVM